MRYGLSWVDGSYGTYELLAFNRTTGTSDPATVQSYRDQALVEVDDYFLHTLSAQFNVAENFQLTAGVRNLLDTQPPRITAFGFSTTGNAPLYSGYDFVGRTYFVNTTFRF